MYDKADILKHKAYYSSYYVLHFEVLNTSIRNCQVSNTIPYSNLQ
jgi:hypothetical protein